MENVQVGGYCWFSNEGSNLETFGRLKALKEEGGKGLFLSSDGKWYSQCGALAHERSHSTTRS